MSGADEETYRVERDVARDAGREAEHDDGRDAECEAVCGASREAACGAARDGDMLDQERIAALSRVELANAARASKVREELGGPTVEPLKGRYVYRFIKRTFDILFSIFMMVCFCWLYAVIAIAIKVDDPSGPVIFRQTRVGKDGSTFTILKFRSMFVDAESRRDELEELNERTVPLFKIANDPRITRVGRWIRKMSLDELPQFVNVLRGDISTVGPRPALPQEVAQYNDYQRQRLLIKPGVTCFWQTRRNRDAISFDEWVDLDLLYIKKCGIWTDFKLIVQTIGVVLAAQGN